MTVPHLRAAPVVALLGALAALGSAPGAAAQATTPAFPAYVDSAGLHAALVALPAGALPDSMPPLFRLTPAPGRVTVQRAVPAMPAAYADPILAAIRAHLRPDAVPSGAPVAHLRAVPGPEGGVAAADPRYTGPRVAAPSVIAAIVHDAMESTVRGGRRFGASQHHFRVSTVVLPTGEMDLANARILHSTGDSVFDGHILSRLRRARLRPARLDGYPISTWVVLPLTFVPVTDDVDWEGRFDLAGLTEAIRPHPRVHRTRWWVSTDGTGGIVVQPLETQLAPETVEAAAEAIHAAHRPGAAGTAGPMHGVLRIDSARVRIDEEQFSIPTEPAHDTTGRAALDSLLRAAPWPGGRPPHLHVRLRVHADGTPDPASLVLPATGSAEADAAVRAFVASRRGRPVRVRGTAVESFAEWFLPVPPRPAAEGEERPDAPAPPPA